MGTERCDIYCYDEETVAKVKQQLTEVPIEDMKKMFKVLADATRLQIAVSLTYEDELCVCDVANITNTSIATASHHLRRMKDMGLAKSRKKGKLVFYSLDDDHVRMLIDVAHAHMNERR